MGDGLLLLVYVAAPIALVLLTRSTTKTVLAIGFAVAIIGGFLQLTTSRGYSWSLGTIQWVLATFLVIIVAAAAIQAQRAGRPSGRALRPQVFALWLPFFVIAGLLVAMRALAPDQPSLLSGVAFLVNHGAAEDNAKWLNLTSQLAVGDPLTFVGGFAGGALIVVMAVTATAARFISVLAYGGVNELAVTVHAVIGATCLLIAATPLALAPLVERKFPSSPSAVRRTWLPAPTLWTGALILACGSTALTFFGHLSLQLVLLMLTIWIAAFLAGPTPRSGMVAAALAVSAGVVWFPLNLLSIAVLVAMVTAAAWLSVRRVQAHKRLDFALWGLVLVTVVSAWDGLVSSTLYALGVGSSGGVASSIPWRGATVPTDTASLFSSPGGTQVASSALVLLAAAVALGAGIFLGQSNAGPRSMVIRFLPLAAVAGYAVLIGVGDGMLTASGENYPTQKMGYAASIIIAAACTPLAIAALTAGRRGMTAARWVAVGAVVFVLSADSLLPRAIATIGPRMWAQPTEGTPYWSTFEVQPVADQSIAALPIACAFLPPGAEVPNGKINGPVTYTCTRMLIGLNGRDARDGSVLDWIRTDWLSDGEFWNDWAPLLAGSPPDILTKKVVLLDAKGNVIGFETLQGLLTRYPPAN